MLHLELRAHENTADIEWLGHENRPAALWDPTPFLLECVSAIELYDASTTN